MASQVQDYRLPTNVKPTHYNLTIWTDLEASKFDGIVEIDLLAKEETSKIVLNTSQQDLGEVSLFSEALNTTQAETTREFDTVAERGTFTFANPLPAGSKARLSIAFKADLTGSMAGYYKSLGGPDNKIVYTLTQFEATTARRAFPCWDEPLLKATYDVTMISRAKTVNLSNMPVISEEIYKPGIFAPDTWLAKKFDSLPDATNWKISRFETTPLVSSYLIAFANGPFEFLESSYKSPLSGKVRPLRIYATADLIGQAQFALDVKRLVLPLYEEVFDVEYPLPKLDTLVATDFDMGAMENWGLITGRTQAFLLDPNSVNLALKQNVAYTQSHEVAHMWFGNITTMEWWDNLYLNEGFATLMGELIILDKVFPEWQLDSSFISDHVARGMALDAKLSSHPIEVECPDANMVNQIFDSLSYAKAGSVLRMLADYVGRDRFLKGVSIYLKKHKFANSVTKDLWEGIQEATGVDIPKMMDNWVQKMGYPIVTVTERPDGIHLRQDRYLETGPADAKHNETIWTIPLGLLTVSEDGKPVVNRELVLDEREKFIPLDTSKPFKLNADTSGFYTVAYSPERLATIGKQAAAKDSPFSLSDRMGVVLNAVALSRSGHSSVSSALALIETLSNETEFLVWERIGMALSQMTSTWYEDEHALKLLNDFRRALFTPLVKRLGFEYKDSEPVTVHQLRTFAIENAASAGEESVIKELQSRFAHLTATGDDSKIPADLLTVTYSMSTKHGGRAEYDAVKRIALKPKNPAVATASMRALGAVRDLKLAEESFQYIMKEARDQDVRYTLAALAGNASTRRFVADSFKANYAAFEKRYEGNFSMIWLTEICFNQLSSKKDHEELTAFFKGKDTSKFQMALQQTLDSIDSRAAWVERSTKELTSWLEAHAAKL